MMLALLASAAALAAPGAVAPAVEVTMPGQRFDPSRVTVLVGEEVVWRNLDSARHTVTADDRSFDSGGIASGGRFDRRFRTAGTYAYHCTIHRFMRGRVEVASLALTAPDEPARPGERVPLEGRAPDGTGTVTLERDGSAVATAEPDEEGAFRFEVVADVPAEYRARASGLASGAVRVGVAPVVRLAALRHRQSVVARVAVDPPQPGGRVVLERYVRERFGYRRLRAVTLDDASRARVTFRAARGLRLRARLAIPVDGYSRSTGTPVEVPGAARRGSHRAHH